MREADSRITIRALEFAARFGFINQQIFFKYLCPYKRTKQYELWSELFADGLLIRARGASETAYLSPRGRRRVEAKSVDARPSYLVPHDSLVAEFLLTLESSGLVEQSWTENELKVDSREAYKVLGGAQLLKYPDLVVQMRSKAGSAKIAVEIERSQKTHVRYSQIALNYVHAREIGLLVFGCETPALRKAVLSAFSKDIVVRSNKTPATFLLEDFASMGIEMEAALLSYKMTFRKMILAALQLPDSAWGTETGKSADNSRTIGGLASADCPRKEVS